MFFCVWGGFFLSGVLRGRVLRGWIFFARVRFAGVGLWSGMGGWGAKKKTRLVASSFFVVRIGGLEPPLREELDPKSSAATNYAISAKGGVAAFVDWESVGWCSSRNALLGRNEIAKLRSFFG